MACNLQHTSMKGHKWENFADPMFLFSLCDTFV